MNIPSGVSGGAGLVLHTGTGLLWTWIQYTVSKFITSSLLPESLICYFGKMFVLIKLKILAHCSDLKMEVVSRPLKLGEDI